MLFFANKALPFIAACFAIALPVSTDLDKSGGAGRNCGNAGVLTCAHTGGDEEACTGSSKWTSDDEGGNNPYNKGENLLCEEINNSIDCQGAGKKAVLDSDCFCGLIRTIVNPTPLMLQHQPHAICWASEV